VDGRGYGGPRWKPERIDVERPSPARIYNYLLGGEHNFDVDRRVVDQILAVDPLAAAAAQANRAFLRRAVQFLIGAGVRQFLDIGSGIPVVGHVHDIAQGADPGSRLAFVDIDPLAVAHSRDILVRNERASVLEEDVRRPERILEAPQVRQLLDFGQPVALLVVALFHYISDADDPADILSRLTEPLAPGSYLVLSHMTADTSRDMVEVTEVFRRGGIALTLRSRAQVESLFAGFDLVEPGVVSVSHWRSDVEDPDPAPYYAGIGRKS
jgi:hypothetical protein